MHVAINGWFWEQIYTGSGQYTRQLVAALCKVDPGLKISLIIPANIQPTDVPAGVDVIPVKLAIGGKPGKIWFEQQGYTNAVQKSGATLSHVPYWGSPLSSPNARLIITIHDVIPLAIPLYQGGVGGRLYTSMVTAGARGAAHIITDSEFSKEEIVARIKGIAPEIVTSIPLAAAPEFHPRMGKERDEQIRQKYDLPDDYALYLGGFDVRKNLLALIAAWTYVKTGVGTDYTLILAGKPPAKWGTARFPDIPAEIKKLELDDVIRYIGPVAEADKPGLYRMARTSIFPSIYEGFGLPPLESMACGTPVVGADATCIPEVTGDAGYLVNPMDSRLLGGAITGMLVKDELHARLGNLGLARATNFSWIKTATATLEVYQKVMAL